jgi:hypothetical protein
MPVESRVELRLPADPIAPALARAGLVEFASQLPADVAGKLDLLATEVVSNAVQTRDLGPTDEVVVRVSHDDLVHVDLTDAGPGFDRDTPRFPGDASGWGLYLVDQLATDWGVEREGACNRVCFELDTRPSPLGKGGE